MLEIAYLGPTTGRAWDKDGFIACTNRNDFYNPFNSTNVLGLI